MAIGLDNNSVITGSTVNITANVVQNQGNTPLTTRYNHIGTCANAGDVVTLPSAVPGLEVIICNDGAQACGVFPATGDDIDAAGVDTKVAQAINTTAWYFAETAITWHKFEHTH